MGASGLHLSVEQNVRHTSGCLRRRCREQRPSEVWIHTFYSTPVTPPGILNHPGKREGKPERRVAKGIKSEAHGTNSKDMNYPERGYLN